jgi:membrane-bound ClpP family serine protease
MTWLIIASLILIGIIFLLLEILVVPGATLVGLMGAGLIVAAVVISFSEYGTETGILTLVISLIASIAAIVLALRSNIWKKAMLSSEMQGRVNIVEAGSVMPGDEGMAVSRLNPYGKAIIKNEYYEVSTKDSFINENTPIIVTKVEGNRIIVKPKI